MQPVLSPNQMRDLESRYMASAPLSSIDLMERAATEIVDLIRDRLSDYAVNTVAFACGPGGNGGDGYAAARLFAKLGGHSIIVPAVDPSCLTGDAKTNYTRALSTPRCRFLSPDALGALPRPALWVDAMFGIGLTRALSGTPLLLARRMAKDRGEGSILLSVDIPSGLHGLTGENLGEAVEADITISFEHAKLGHFLADGPELTGELIIPSIGIPDDLLTGKEALRVEFDDLAPIRAPRRRNTHKGTYGHLLLIAGSRGMAGAAMIAAMAALKSGVGLLTIACPESLLPILQTAVPCAMCLPLPERDGALTDDAINLLREAIPGKRAIAIGPGLSTRASSSVLELVLESELPSVIDADALNLLSQNPNLRALLRPRHIITPHPGEAARLLGRSITSPFDDAMSLHKMGCTALLKGATTVIAGERVYLSTSGTPGMAKGGSGDALTGIIGSLLAQGYSPDAAAYIGSELHGLAGECAAARVGPVCMSATDLVDHLREAFQLVY